MPPVSVLVSWLTMVPQLPVQVCEPEPPELVTASPTLMIWFGYEVPKLAPTVKVVPLIAVVSLALLVQRAPMEALPRPLYEEAFKARGDGDPDEALRLRLLAYQTSEYTSVGAPVIPEVGNFAICVSEMFWPAVSKFTADNPSARLVELPAKPNTRVSPP